MTIFGIGGCMSLILVGFGLRDSIFDISRLQFKEIQTYDGLAYLRDDASEEEKRRLEEELKKNERVRDYLDVRVENVTIVKGGARREVYETVPRDVRELEKFVNFRDRVTKKKRRLEKDGAILSEKTAKLIGAREGDTFYIEKEDGKRERVKLLGVCENYMGDYLYMSPALYGEVYGKSPIYNCGFFKVKEGENVKGVGEKLLSQEGVMNVTYIKETQKQLDDMLKSLNLVIIVLIVSAGMLAFVVLYNLNTINIAERKRELATLKVLGFYNREVGAYVYRENIILTCLGVLAGMLMGVVLHRFVVRDRKSVV